MNYLYMIHDDQIFVANVMVIDSIQKMMTMNVISPPTSAIAKFNAIVKIHKYRRLHERHHFILMTMEMHGALECDMDRFIRECFHDR